MFLNRFCIALGIWLVAATVGAAPSMTALIIDGHHNHDWIHSTPILKTSLEATGRFSVDVATAPTVGGSFTVNVHQAPPHSQDLPTFLPNLAAYDVVVMNYTNAQVGWYGGCAWSNVNLTYNSGEWSAADRAALESYVGTGGGLVIIHGADNSFPTWQEYNKMIGVGWGRTELEGPYVYWQNGQVVRDMTPGLSGAHGSQRSFAVDVRNPGHPIMQGMPAQFQHATDELYSMLRGPAENLTVLATASSVPDGNGHGRDEPVLMTTTYGQGRVFHTALGHANVSGPPFPAFDDPFTVTFQRGAEWAAAPEPSTLVLGGIAAVAFLAFRCLTTRSIQRGHH